MDSWLLPLCGLLWSTLRFCPVSSLRSLSSYVACQDNFTGLPGGAFKYFKVNFDKGKVVDTWREVYIDPEYAFVAWGDGEKYPHPLLGRKSFDLGRLKITAEDAIRIAEENGGREARLRLQNRCYIHLFFMPERFKGWVVDYGFSADFEILIDPYTGKIYKDVCSFGHTPFEEMICNLHTIFPN